MNTYEYIFNKNTDKACETAMHIRLDGGGVRAYTYEQLFAHVDVFLEALKCAEIVPGDRVSIIAENCPEWCIAYLAIAKLHATAVLIDASLEREELFKLLEKSKVRGIFTTTKVIEKLSSFPNSPMFDILNNAAFFEGYENKTCALKMDCNDENVSTIIFSSGTTKTASGIMHSHDSLIGTTEMVIKYFPLHNNHRFLAVLPNSHIYGLICQVIGSLVLGAELCFLEGLSADGLSNAFEGFQPTIFPAVPKIYELLETQIMRKIGGNSKTQNLFSKFFPICLALRKKTGINIGKMLFKEIHKGFGGKMEILCSAGAPLKAETAEFFYGTGFDIFMTYGATETNIPTIGNYGGIITTDTCGKAYPDVCVKINGDGEILVKSPYTMLGYFDDEEATRSAFDDDGWFKTGDLGFIDSDTGYIKILGRCKDNIVLSTGKKIAPDDIENAYVGIEGTKELVICGVPMSDGSYDEVHAFVVTEPSVADLVLERFIQKSTSLPFNMKLTDIHIVDAIPKTSLQKPKRYLLRQMAGQNRKTAVEMTINNINAVIDIALIVRESVAKIARIDISKVLPETKLFTEFAIDSLGSIELCCELEDKCEVSTDIACFLHKEMTVAELTEYITKPYETKDIKHGLKQSYPLKKNKNDYKTFRFVQRLLHRVYNIRIDNDKVLPNDSGYIICSNHVSNFDYLFLTLNFKWERFSHFCCMAKKELIGKKPHSKVITKIAGMVPVDRGSFVNDAFNSVCDKLKERWGVLIHPEGTRSEDGKICTFKKGAALLSIEADVPIVPAYIEGGYEIYPKSKKLPNLFNWKEKKRYCVEVKYGDPIFPKGMSADELIKMVETAVMQLKQSTTAISAHA